LFQEQSESNKIDNPSTIPNVVLLLEIAFINSGFTNLSKNLYELFLNIFPMKIDRNIVAKWYKIKFDVREK